MYRIGIEELLGLTLNRGALRINPCIPKIWPRFEAVVRTPTAEFHVVVENPDGVTRGVKLVEVDGKKIEGDVPMVGVEGSHTVRVVLGP